MTQIPDDPIIACMERTGYPPRMQEDDCGEEEAGPLRQLR